MTALLKLDGLRKNFGGLAAVSDVGFELERGEILGIIGPNGAGKTTLFNVVAGYYRPSAGHVVFEGEDVTGRSSNRIARLGIARTFQAALSFKSCSVAENLRRAAVVSRFHDPFSYLTRRGRRGEVAPQEVAAFLGLSARLDSPAGELAYGQQKVLGIGMAMMVAPKLMLMDEPAAGLNPTEKKAVGGLIRRLRDERGISILIVEHDMPLVMALCDRVLVINQGRMLAIGTPGEIKRNADVIDAYLGEDYEFA